ncbi:hypothetical protein BDW02DRAFT_47988 [Decorospora gaudefroyi]|uniref:UbiA prenyltransferase n=1 Tax=Decorospora gaudefroyi TaxID=184978 RepID=A0A6A5K366_9PLEO|nr:hypothetical protein BDW02DRAFT_47988 [Decorospora gaudefroyi]
MTTAPAPPPPPPPPPPHAQCPLRVLPKLARSLWALTRDDLFTFVLPNTIFGICTALAGPPFTSDSVAGPTILTRIPLVVAFNWTNVLVFELANQRLYESVLEDGLNKPYRPIPAGLMTRSDVRRALQLVIPAVLAFNHYVLCTGAETACVFVGCWVYNDLKGSDDSWLLRNAIIALAFGVFNWTSVKVAVGGGGGGGGVGGGHVVQSSSGIESMGWNWIRMYSLIIFTTMQVQDMKDQAGDRARGRKTAPLVVGDWAARWSIAVPTLCWGPICALYFQVHGGAMAVVVVVGVWVAWRCVWRRGCMHDRRTWHVWCAWTAILSLMPLYRLRPGFVLA